MSEKKLTAAQIKALEPYERNFHQATEAAWCSYPGQAGINLMLEVWTDLTGTAYPYKPGCPNCLINLVRDLGTLYFAQKDEALAAEKKNECCIIPDIGDYKPEEMERCRAKVAEMHAEELKAPKVSKTTKGKRGPKKGKK